MSFTHDTLLTLAILAVASLGAAIALFSLPTLLSWIFGGFAAIPNSLDERFSGWRHRRNAERRMRDLGREFEHSRSDRIDPLSVDWGLVEDSEQVAEIDEVISWAGRVVGNCSRVHHVTALMRGVDVRELARHPVCFEHRIRARGALGVVLRKMQTASSLVFADERVAGQFAVIWELPGRCGANCDYMNDTLEELRPRCGVAATIGPGSTNQKEEG